MKGTGTQVLSSEQILTFVTGTRNNCHSPYDLMEFVADIHKIKQQYKFPHEFKCLVVEIYSRFIDQIKEQRSRELKLLERGYNPRTEPLCDVKEFLYYTRVIPNLQYLQSVFDEYNISYPKKFNDISVRETFTLESLSENIILDDIFDERYKQPTLE